MSKRNKAGAKKQRKGRSNDNLSVIQKKMREAVAMREEVDELTEERQAVFKSLVDEDKGGLFVDAIDLENNITAKLEAYIEKVENVGSGLYTAKAIAMLDGLKDWCINMIEEWPDLAGEEDTEEETPAETEAPRGKNGKPKKEELEAAQVG